MLSFHNDKAVKEKYLNRVLAHQKADEIIKGVYWENGKGCAVGCTIHGSNHHDYEKELGIPEGLARLEDDIFENLSNGDAKSWPAKFLRSVNVGVNLELVGWKFNFWLQTENLKFAKKEKMPADVIAAIKMVIDYLKPVADGKPIDEKARSAARSAAWSAAESAARSAAESAAWSAAESAARSAARSAAWSAARSAAESAAWSAARSAAESAAWSAARSAAESAAWSAAYKKMSDKLLKLLKEAK